MSHHRVDLTPAYVLHTRPFRNTSLIVELFSQAHGRIAVVANSARGLQSRFKGQLQLFTPLLVSWFGQRELKTLTHSELNGMPLQLNQTPLFCGFYLNELLIRLLHKEDPHPQLFELYHDTLICFEKCVSGSAKNNVAVILRIFEKKLLTDLGYGLSLFREAKTGSVVQPNSYYTFQPEQGVVLSADTVQNDRYLFLGRHLIAIGYEQFDDELVLASAKRLMRLALSSLLGDTILNSRFLF